MIRTLQSLAELGACRSRLRHRKLDFTEANRTRFWQALYRIRYRALPPIPDFRKSWDIANTLEIIERLVPDRDTSILDMGCFNSEILYTLHALRYRRLHGCDLNPLCRWMPFWHRIRYRLADLTQTPYPSGQFGVVTCLSVIEHGVPVEKLVPEVTRLLKPGGLFIFTTDYDAAGRLSGMPEDFRVFGLKWRIFNREDLHGIIEQFTRKGFALMNDRDVHDAHSERPISWNGRCYTFILVALRSPTV
jgi:SAM-dependent methyltransferase